MLPVRVRYSVRLVSISCPFWRDTKESRLLEDIKIEPSALKLSGIEKLLEHIQLSGRERKSKV